LHLKKQIFRSLIILGLICFSSGALMAQSSRAVKQTASYTRPELAKKMHVSGDVKVEVVVAPNGTVKSAKALGGHPLLVDTAVEAAKKFKYDTASDETKETIVFHFPDSQ